MPDLEDKNIWHAYAAKVRPMSDVRARAIILKAEKIDKKEADQRRLSLIDRPSIRQTAQNKPSFSTQETVALFDRRMERRLREGSVMIEARLDLHGMTQDEAYAALHHFMAAQVKAQHRTVLIITGKGRGGDGVLRTHLQGWLQSLPVASHILALRPAALRHGGMGAFYVMLRRKKEKT